MAKHVAYEMAELEEGDFYLLSGVEHGMRFSEWVNRENLPEYSRLDQEEVNYRIDRTLDRDLIQRKTIQYEGFQLTTRGYDALALRTFAKRDTVEGFGSPLGVGKESDVYEVQSYKPLALKFHREGFTNFREVHRERDYASEKEHVSWLYTARKAAEREYETLEDLYPDVNVPRPIDQNRHAIVMDKMDGVELSRADLDEHQVIGILDLILDELASAYERGYVHADVSEYNIFVSSAGVTVFDWPQAVATEHENAREFLNRDVENLIDYMRRIYPSSLPDIETENIATQVAQGTFESVN
ncbi:MAG: serine/threonine-protein kinase RIO2 [Halobacteriaceae archaeon]